MNQHRSASTRAVMAGPEGSLLRDFVTALQKNQRREVNVIAFRLLEQQVPIRDKWRLVAKVLQTNGELSSANRAMQLYVEQTGGTHGARFEQAAVAAQTGRLQQAWDIMATIPPDVPDRAGHAFIRGTMAINLGELEVAEEHLQAAIESNPQLGQAMLALAACRPRKAGDPIGDRILASRGTMTNTAPLERAQYHYATGRIHFDRREAEEAFAEFAEGAALAARLRPYDFENDSRDALRSRKGYDRKLIDHIASQVRTDSSEAIFVTGLPRSGTTLVEQILVSHSSVVGGEELGRMGIVQRDLPENSAAGLQAYLESGQADDLTELYLHLCRERFGASMRYVDKGLNSTRHIGLIAATLPQSPIIWMRRNPLDCAWSAFRTYFVLGLEWSWRLEDIARHFQLEDELFDFWSNMLPDRILVVEYSELVTDPQAQIERILAHCKLPLEPQVFEPHKTKRVVSTASVMQVREPINRRGIGSAGPYRAQLQPFVDAYGG